MRRKPIFYPPPLPPHPMYFPKVVQERPYREPPPMLLDPWEKKLHYNDFGPSRFNFNLNNPRDPRLPGKVDVRYYQNAPARYLRPLYADRDYDFDDPFINVAVEEADRYTTGPPLGRFRRRSLDFNAGFLSFPDRDYRHYKRDFVDDFRDEDLLRDDSRSHVTVYHPRHPIKRQFPRKYHHPRRNWRFPEVDNESEFLDFTSQNELDSNLASLGSNYDSLNANYHKRRDHKLPNFKSYDDWRIQKNRAKQLSTIPANPKLWRENFWTADSHPEDRRRNRRKQPSFKNYADWNVPRDRHAVSTVAYPFPEDQDDFPSSIPPLESRVGGKFSTSPFARRSTIDASSLIRPYQPKPRPDPEANDKERRTKGTRDDPMKDIPGNRSRRDDRISNAGSDNLSHGVANRSTNSKQMDPVFNKDSSPKKAPKSTGSI